MIELDENDERNDAKLMGKQTRQIYTETNNVRNTGFFFSLHILILFLTSNLFNTICVVLSSYINVILN